MSSIQLGLARKYNKQVHPMEIWAFTVKILSRKGDIDEKSYTPFFDILYSLGKGVRTIAELDKSGILHYHGIVTLPWGFYRKFLCPKGFHVKLKRVYNFLGWEKYMMKNYKYQLYDTTIDYSCYEKI